MNFLISIISVGTRYLIIFSIFSESVHNLSVPIVCLKNLIFLYSNLYFLSFIMRFASFNFVKTFLKWFICSSKVSKHTNISSKYTTTKSFK